MPTQPVPYQQPYATPAGHPAPARDLVIHQPAPIELYGDRQPVVYVPSAENPNVMVAIPKHYVQPLQPAPERDLTPQPLFDPGAQKILATGVGAGAALWGGGQLLIGASQVLSALTGAGALLFFLAIAGARVLLTSGRSGDTYVTHNHNRGFSRSTTHNH